VGNSEGGWVAEEVNLEHRRWGDNSRIPEEELHICIRTMFWGDECHKGVTVEGWGVTAGSLDVTVGGWDVTVGGRGVTVVGWGVIVGGWDVTVGDWGVTMADIIVGEIDVTNGTMVVTVEEWFITVVGAWWGWFAEQGGQTQPPTSTRENMDLRVGPGSPEQVEWTHLL